MAAALHLSGVKTPFQFMPKSNSSSCYQSTPIQFMSKRNCSSRYQSIHIRRQQHHLVVFQPPRLPGHSSLLRLRCEAVKVDVLQSQHSDPTPNENEFNCVIKFGSSSLDSADKMREAAEFIRNIDSCIRSFESFEEKRPVIVLSAMGKTTTKLQLAVEKAVSCDVSDVSDLEELTFIKDLHLSTADELGIDREITNKHLFELEELLKVIATIKEINATAKDDVVSFGKCLSTRIFVAYLNKIGVKAREVFGHSTSLGLRCASEAATFDVLQSQNSDQTPNENKFYCVIKFGSSSIASADRMREAAEFIRSLDRVIRSFEIFEKKRPAIALSAMGKTTSMIKLAGEKAVSPGVNFSNVTNLEEFTFIKDFYLRTADELGIKKELISRDLSSLESYLTIISKKNKLIPKSKALLVSVVEDISTTIFVSYLNKIGVKAQEIDSFDNDFGNDFKIIDNFMKAIILDATYPPPAKSSLEDCISDPSIPFVSVVGRFKVTRWDSLESDGSDVTDRTMGKSSSLRKILVFFLHPPNLFKLCQHVLFTLVLVKLLMISQPMLFMLLPKLLKFSQLVLSLLNPLLKLVQIFWTIIFLLLCFPFISFKDYIIFFLLFFK